MRTPARKTGGRGQQAAGPVISLDRGRPVFADRISMGDLDQDNSAGDRDKLGNVAQLYAGDS